jgi:hypothetical protein
MLHDLLICRAARRHHLRRPPSAWSSGSEGAQARGFKVTRSTGTRASRRVRAIKGLKTSEIDILVDTDVAARGPTCRHHHVVNYSQPNTYTTTCTEWEDGPPARRASVYLSCLGADRERNRRPRMSATRFGGGRGS